MKAAVFCLLMLAAAPAAAAEDARQLAAMPAAAQATLRAEMRANMVALNEILSLVTTGKLAEAGALAEKELGVSAMGKHRALPSPALPRPASGTRRSPRCRR